jgi:hypothetical protein
MAQSKLNPNPKSPDREMGNTQNILQRAGIVRKNQVEVKEVNLLGVCNDSFFY